MPKRSIRQKLLMQRRLLAVAECSQRSRVVQQRLLATRAYDQASVLALYAPIHNEVQTEDVFAAALHDGKRVCFPRVQGAALEFIEVRDQASLQPGAFGILEPTGAEVLASADIDLVVLPGVGFDRTGYRLGYGQGYYDRTVPAEGSAVLAGLAYDFQVVDELPAEDHDICLDLLIVDSEVLVFDRKQKQ